MDRERWQKIKGLLEEAEGVPVAERAGWLDRVCEGDASLRRELVGFLDEEEPATSALQAPLRAAGRPPTIGEQAGRVLGAWRLVRRLGAGGMGSVWLAERADEAFTMPAAVKLIKRALLSPEAITRFKRERQLLADLRHPNIAALHDGGTTEEGAPYLVMEFVAGRTIDSWCAEQRPSNRLILELFRQLCGAVAYAHRHGVLHRDIKPANVMVDAEGHVKLLDFGIASAAVEGETSLTAGPHAPMTPEYASPERFRGEPVTAAADIYALGLVLFGLLSGLRPKEMDGNPVAALDRWRKALGDKTAATREVHEAALSEALIQPLRGMLAAEPAERTASVDEVIRALDEIPGATQGTSSRSEGLGHEALVWYAPAAAERAERLAQRLELEHHLHCWFDRWHQVPSSDRTEALSEALADSTALLVIHDDTDDGPWHDAEVRGALTAAQSGLQRRVVPLLLGESERPERESDLPAFLRRRDWLRLTEPSSDSLDELARALRGLARGRTTEPTATSSCPFRGLEVFREEDARFFRGREALVGRLAEHMRRHRFLAVLGPSGSGKSSVVQAGLVPRLREEGYEIALFTPTAHPLTELAYALSRCFPEIIPAETLLKRLGEDARSLYFIARELAAAGGPTRVCLVIDQLEELFTLAGEDGEADAFLAALFAALEHENSGLAVVVTLRSDFLGKCVRYPDLATYCSEKMVLVDPMSQEELLRAMTEPAALAGLIWEPGLPERILEDVAGDAGELPLLEHALLELYEHRRGRLLTAATYNEIGGIEGALARRAEGLYESLTEDEQLLVRKIFTLCLVHPGEGAEDTRRRATREELLAVGGDSVQTDDLLDRFVAARLLTARSDERRGLVLVDVSHEALIRKWDRIGTWMAEDRETARQFNRLRRRAGTWQEANRHEDFLLRGGELYQMTELYDRASNHLGTAERAFVEASRAAEQRDQQRKRRTRNLMAALALAATILAVFSFKTSLDARKAESTALAEKQRVVAEKREGNYNLAIAFDKQAGIALDKNEPVEAWLSSLAALSQDIPPGKDLLEPQGRFADGRMWGLEKQLWASPVAPRVSRVACSPDGKTLALAGEDRIIRLMDNGSGVQAAILSGAKHAITDLAFSPDGRLLAAASADREVYLWTLDNGALRILSDLPPGRVTALAFSADGAWLASAGESGPVLLHPLEASQEATQLPLSQAVHDLVFGSGGTLYAATDGGVLALDTQKRVWEPGKVPGGSIATALVWHPRDGLICGWQNGTVTFQRGSTYTIEAKAHSGPVHAIGIDPSGEWLVTSATEEVVHWQNRPIPAPSRLEGLTGATSVCLEKQGRLSRTTPEGQLKRYDLATKHDLPGLTGHDGTVWSVAFSPDGRWLASSSSDGTIGLWDRRGILPSRRLRGHSDRVMSVAFSPDGSRLASASWDKTVRLWDLANPSSSLILTSHSKGVQDLAFSPDGTHLASASRDETVRLWNLADPSSPQILRGHSGSVMSVVYSPDGSHLASASDDQTVRLWNLSDPSAPRVLDGHSAGIKRVVFSPDGTQLASASSDQTVRLWDLVSSNAPRVLSGHSSEVWEVAFAPDGKHLASVSDQTVRLWDLANPSSPRVLSGSSENIVGVAFSPDGSRLATTGVQTVRLWDPVGQSSPSVLKGHSGYVVGVAFAPDGTRLASASGDKTVGLWDLAGPNSPRVLIHHSADVYGVAFSPDGWLLASASLDQTVRLWDLKSPKTPRIFSGHSAVVFGVAFAPNGSRLASSSADRTVRLWDLDSPKAAQVLRGHSAIVFGVAFSPDGSLLASASSDKTVRLWDLADPSSPRVLIGHSDVVMGVAFSPDGSLLASASYDKTVRLWDLSGKSSPRVLQGHTAAVYGVTFSPDGQWLASTSADRTARIWRVADGTQLAVLKGHEGEVNWFPAFSPDGSLLATPSDDKTIRLWRMDRLLQLKPGIESRQWYAELLARSLYFFGYRQDGFNFVSQPHMRLQGDEPHPYDHLDRPRPTDVPLVDWLMKGYGQAPTARR